MSSVLSSLLVVLSLAGGAQSPPAADADVALDVPRASDRCDVRRRGGGDALRFWETRTPDPRFDALVDRRKGGIATDSLTSAVEARHWRVRQTGDRSTRSAPRFTRARR